MNVEITCQHGNNHLDCRKCDAEAQGGIPLFVPGCVDPAPALIRYGCPMPPLGGSTYLSLKEAEAGGDINQRAAASNALDNVMDGMRAELESATAKWPPFNSAHEGFAVLAEEVDELWDHVKVNQKRRDLAAMRKEALQVAAMALRFALDVCDETRGRK